MKLPRNAKIFRGQLDAAPFASVFFLLLFFLLLSSRLVFTPGVHVALPEVGEHLPGVAGPTLTVAIDASGQFYFDRQAVAQEALPALLKARVKDAPGTWTLEIVADKSATIETAYWLLSAAGELGFKDAICTVRPPPLPRQLSKPAPR